MLDIIIIGAGPSGLTAALYAARANKKVLVLEANCYGGQIVNANKIENYPGIASISGVDFANNLYNQVIDLGVSVKFEKVVKIKEDKTVVTDKNEYKGKAVIIATGVSSKKLNIENEINLIGKGISYCATCDGNFYKDKVVAVIGGGNTALQDSIYLSDICKKVYLIHRRSEFRGEDKYQSLIKEKDNIELVLDSKINKINGIDELTSIDIIDNSGNISNLDIQGLFVAIGQTPNNLIFNNVVDIDDFGYIVSDDGVHTKTKNIYVAGDVRVKELRQLTTAVGDGSLAATMAIREIK